MVMTKSRRASPAKAKASPVETLPSLAGLWTEADIQALTNEMLAELEEAKQGASGPHGQAALQIIHISAHAMGLQQRTEAWLGMAFQRIDKLERELRAAKSMSRKSLDDLSVEQIDDRRVRFAFGKGASEASFEVAIPAIIDRGLWSERASYHRGDAITQSGGLWIAQEDDPPGKPGAAGSGWRLAVKPGKDAK